DSAGERLRFQEIDTLVYSAGVYENGPLVELSTAARANVLGVNIVCKIEVLHAVLAFNRTNDFDSSRGLTFVDVGSTHGLSPSATRSLYAPSKAFGLDLCIALCDGREVKRCLHVAPGPVDTYMLHRNHWVAKEQGPSQFLDFIHDNRP